MHKSHIIYYNTYTVKSFCIDWLALSLPVGCRHYINTNTSYSEELVLSVFTSLSRLTSASDGEN